MTKISQLLSVGDFLSTSDQFLIRDVSDIAAPNKSATISGMTRALDSGTALAPALAFAADKNTGLYNPASDTLAFVEGGIEVMRLASTGYLKASNTGAYTSATGSGQSTSLTHFLRSDQNAPTVLATNTSTSGAVEGFSSDLAAGATGAHFVGSTGATRVFVVTASGNVTNTNNSYGAISDLKLKENIVDANSQWSDIKALQVRKYNFKNDQAHTQIGLVAQEVELVSPGLVSKSPDLDEEGNDLGTVTKSVNYSVLYVKAVKALQEAMERIEQLEQRLTKAGIA